jgi:hypothetical protein
LAAFFFARRFRGIIKTQRKNRGGVAVVAWIPYIPTIISALVQLAKLLVDLAAQKETDKIKDCAIAIEDARKSGDVSKLTAIIEQMRKGKPCE